ncbi:MAG: DUF177 domain-containing protein [Dehalococcoidia bacterium]|nr:DUF177 domain-containing protein [Dehalococcoidia bacterium]MDW8120245.1 DUF177 domain-containing protein [Chloroflexota bacterium]
MQFNVATLLKEPVGSARVYTLDEEQVRLDDLLVAPFHSWVRFTRTEKGIWVQARVDTAVASTCSRCLAEFSQRLQFTFDEEFFPTVDVHTGARLPLPPPEQESFTIDAHHLLDLTEVMRQYALVSIPMKPLCRADCRGLCPTCGADLNSGPCTCPAPVSDPRWEALRRLLPPDAADKP